MVNKLPGEQDGGQTNGLGYSININRLSSSSLFYTVSYQGR